jgi:hypothetical protein
MRRATVLVFLSLLAVSSLAASLPSPEAALGKAVGQDRVLASYEETVAYLRKLSELSPRVRVEELGATVSGRPMIAVVVSSPANMAKLEAIRRGWARLADPRQLNPAEREALLSDLPAGLLVTAGIHSTEVAGPQAVLLFAHELAAAGEGSSLGQFLSRVVVFLVPSLNPDGQEAVVAWYQKHLGTPFEGSSPPFLYHPYAGHHNNRPLFSLPSRKAGPSTASCTTAGTRSCSWTSTKWGRWVPGSSYPPLPIPSTPTCHRSSGG